MKNATGNGDGNESLSLPLSPSISHISYYPNGGVLCTFIPNELKLGDLFI